MSFLFCRLKATLLSDVRFNFNCHITTPPTNTKWSSLYSALHQFAALLTTMPAGPDLDDLIKLYFRLSLSNKEILAILAHTNHIVISVRTLKRICKRLNLFRRKNQSDLEEVLAFVQHEIRPMDRCRDSVGYISVQFNRALLCHKIA